ncbi:MAG: M56 family metallopeptidase [Actinomycetota bacterium]
MSATWIGLAALAVALAWPVPILLSRARWPARAPGTALLVWEAIALAGGLSMIGALLSYGLQPFGATFIDGLLAVPRYLLERRLPATADFGQMFALSGGVLLAIHLLLNLALTAVRAERSRTRHRQLVTLLSTPMPQRPGLRLIDHQAPVAYCLPGTTRSVTVLSAGLLELLDETQLRAVISHENAHAAQRHHLVLLAFRAWSRSLPWFPIATRALVEVATLVEMLADDRARQEVSDDALAQSIALVASASGASAVGARTPDFLRTAPDAAANALAADGDSAHRRIARLVGSSRPLGIQARLFAVGCSVALLAVPTALLVYHAFQ